ncbi:hypothetical protein B0A52_06142 [Exophiala mesophila]|uniref:Uncharacterized protein n=1 Tax=Exophiala mesophila TaxID=212818 RepID=A0A438N5P1_EXOME|nr:hypothetical protein B0A52_06142 [Exophiala mesophila]
MLSLLVICLAVVTGLQSVGAQSTDDNTEVKNAVLKVTCPQGGSGSVVLQLDPDSASNYAHYVGLLNFPATMFFLNTDTTNSPDECTPPGAMFALQFPGPGSLDSRTSTYTLTGVKVLDAGSAMVAASDAINNAMTPDPNKEAENLIDVLNSDGSSGLGDAFADSITPTPELISAANLLQSLTTVTPVPVVAQSDAAADAGTPASRNKVRSNELATRDAALIILSGELATDGEIAGSAAAIPVLGEVVIAVIGVVAVLQTITAVLPDPKNLRSYSDDITYKTTLVTPWIVVNPDQPEPVEDDIPNNQCDIQPPANDLPREKDLPSKGPCDVYLKNVLWNQPKVDWSKEVGKEVDYNAADSKISGTVTIKCKPTAPKKWMAGKYWHRLYPVTTDPADSGSQSSSSDSQPVVSDTEVQIPDLGVALPPNSDGEGQCLPSPEWQAKPYFTVDVGGEYTMLGEAFLEFNFAVTTKMTSGKFDASSGTPGFSQQEDGNGIGGIEIYGIKAQGDQLYANAGLKIAAGIKYLRNKVEVWDMSTTLQPGIWLSGVQEVGSDQITISTRPVDATSSSTASSTASISTPTTFNTVFTTSSSSTSSDSSDVSTVSAPAAAASTAVQTSDDDNISATATATATSSGIVKRDDDDSSAATTTSSSVDPSTTTVLSQAESVCVTPLAVKLMVSWQAAIKFMGKQIFLQELIPASLANKYLTLKLSPAQPCFKSSSDFPS